MAISEDEAAAIARRHGLGLSDALALRDLARDADHAEELAGHFAPEVDNAEEGREIADRILDGGRI